MSKERWLFSIPPAPTRAVPRTRGQQHGTGTKPITTETGTSPAHHHKTQDQLKTTLLSPNNPNPPALSNTQNRSALSPGVRCGTAAGVHKPVCLPQNGERCCSPWEPRGRQPSPHRAPPALLFHPRQISAAGAPRRGLTGCRPARGAAMAPEGGERREEGGKGRGE